jgi:hypothetical protein
MTQSKSYERARAGDMSALAFGRSNCSAVPTSAKQFELRARYEAALTLLDQLPDSECVQKKHPVNVSVTALAQ